MLNTPDTSAPAFNPIEAERPNQDAYSFPAEPIGPVWVVDDDDVRESLSFALQPRFNTFTFPSLEAFLSKADLNEPGCLVITDRFGDFSDDRAPALLGEQSNVQQALEERRSPISVVFLSSENNVRAAVRAMRAGAVSFLEKPVDPEELSEAVSEGLEKALRLAKRNELSALFESLSKRERQIFVLICHGLKNGDIAKLLELSQRTVEVHRAHITRKLGNSTPIRLLYELILAEGESIFDVPFDGINPEKLAEFIADADEA